MKERGILTVISGFSGAGKGTLVRKLLDEFLVHAVDSEGKSAGIDEKLIEKLAQINHTITYAGGISSYDDIRRLDEIGKGRVNFTVGSRLDIFGGELSMGEIIKCIR